jgi:hypothetical protein
MLKLTIFMVSFDKLLICSQRDAPMLGPERPFGGFDHAFPNFIGKYIYSHVNQYPVASVADSLIDCLIG